ncbi:hypothetical protein [Enterococcus cecorum]|uniref:hypothetical protein n=1 Tax=Enterococcus cecorum TaxID=44008 RepID=UPI000642FD46|nr:hypothetical protein [Enterococcus cecorum]KLO73806.1 hypothetical protein AA989_05990 [Enterococcus cecorum]
MFNNISLADVTNILGLVINGGYTIYQFTKRPREFNTIDKEIVENFLIPSFKKIHPLLFKKITASNRMQIWEGLKPIKLLLKDEQIWFYFPEYISYCLDKVFILLEKPTLTKNDLKILNKYYQRFCESYYDFSNKIRNKYKITKWDIFSKSRRNLFSSKTSKILALSGYFVTRIPILFYLFLIIFYLYLMIITH